MCPASVPTPSPAGPARPSRRRPSRLRKLALQLFGTLAALALLEAGARLVVDVPDSGADPFVGFSGRSPVFVLDEDGSSYVTAPSRRRHFNVQRFTASKPPGTTRVVCLGGSTTYGRPYTDATSFPGWMRALLPALAPSRDWEVINAGGVSYASYRVAVVAEELARHDPDVVVVYTGHNEFLEERTYAGLRETPPLARATGRLLRRTALFTAARRWWHGSESEDPDRFELGTEVAPLLDRSIGPDAYRRDDELAAAVVEHFRFNLRRMVALARAAGARVVLVVPASQLVGCRPFRSEPTDGLPPETVARVDGVLEHAEAALADDGPIDPALVAELERAARDDPRRALVHHLLGEALLRAGDVDGARRSLRRGRDEDIVPLRAVSPLVEAVRQVAAEEDTLVVDAVALAEERARAHGAALPGPEVFLDHVHMTIEAYRHLALAILEVLEEAGLVRPSVTDREAAVAAVVEEVDSSLDTEAHVRALTRLAAVLDWAGKSAEAESLTDRALALSGGADAASHWHKGNRHLERGELDAAAASYRRALAIDPAYGEAHANLAETLRLADRPTEALHHFDETRRLMPLHAPGAFGRALVLERLDRRGAAEAAYREAIDLDPTHVDARNALAILLLRDGRRAEAEALLRDTLAVAPESARTHYHLGLLLQGTRRLVEALDSYRSAVRHDPGHVRALRRLGATLADLGRSQEAVEALEAARSLAPDDPGIRAELEAARTRLAFDNR